MKRTVSANISGQFFHIDDDAYEKLSRYLETIRAAFSQEDGRDEIMSDIEGRIAEMLKEKTSDRRQVINLQDVDAVIATMGQPEDFAEGAGPSESIPRSSTTERVGRRIYRNPDDKILGGVCGGLAAYFNTDALWLRLALVIMLFLFGFGPLIYILLWIIIPEAKTPSEKLAMRGEPITVDNISRTIRDEMSGVGERIKSEAQSFKKKDPAGKVRNAVEEILHALGNLIGLFARAFVKLLAVAFIAFSLLLIFLLTSLIFTDQLVVHFNDDWNYFSFHEAINYLVPEGNVRPLLMTGLALVLLIPICGLLIAGFRMLVNFKTRFHITGPVLGVFWLIGFGLLVYSASVVSADYASRHSATSNYDIALNVDTLRLNVDESRRPNWDNVIADDQNKVFIALSADSLYLSDVQLKIVQSPDSIFHLEQQIFSRGETRSEALKRAEHASYIISVQDSVLSLSEGLYIARDDGYRKQKVRLTLFVPEGKSVLMDQNAKWLMENRHCDRHRKDSPSTTKTLTMHAGVLSGLDEHSHDSENHRCQGFNEY